jgi:transcriptional antiterminator
MSAVLESSRRTVFRDLKTIDRSLEQVQMVSALGSGIRLECGDLVCRELASLLDKEPILPGNRRLRLLCLLLELLANSGSVQKLFYYSDNLGGSESMVIHDLDALEPLFKKHAISLIHWPGQGIEEVLRQYAGELDFTLFEVDIPEVHAFILIYSHVFPSQTLETLTVQVSFYRLSRSLALGLWKEIAIRSHKKTLFVTWRTF